MPSRRRTKRILNAVPSADTEQDWRFEHAEEAGLLMAPAAAPKTKDLREAWWAIANQGSTGSCVGWATADGILRWHFVKANRLAQVQGLSVRFMWMASKETDANTFQPTTFIETAGTQLKAALDVARKFGVVEDTVVTFGGKLYGGEAEAFYALAAQRKIAAYFNLSLSRGARLNDWKRWIATKGPILTRFDVDRTWDDAEQTGGNLDAYRADTKRGGHAVTIVGYTADRFIVRNSWGTTWGDQGFGYASPAYAKAAFTEAYGVTV